MTQDGAGAPETPDTIEAARAVIGQQLQERDRQKATIEQQAHEIARLRQRLDDGILVRDLREAVRLSATAEAIAAPVSHSRLLDMIVATAADIIGANAASLFLIDREQENLVFEVALGLFATQAAVAIEQSRNHGRLEALVANFVQSLGGIPDHQRQTLAERTASFARDVSNDPEYLRSLELARRVQEIVGHGERATDACQRILESFAAFLRSRPATAGEMGLSSEPGFSRW